MVCIPIVDPNCHPLESVVADAATTFLGSLAKMTADAATEMLKLVVTGWTNIPSTQVGTVDSSVPIGTVAHLQDATWWITAALAVFGVLYKGARMAITGSGNSARLMSRSLLILVLVSGIGIGMVQLLTEVGDAYSSWIIDKSLGVDPNSNTLSPFETKLALLSPAGLPVLASPIMMIGIALFLMSIVFAQVLMMYGRMAGLILMTGLMPVAAAGGISGGAGKTMRQRYFSWLLAFVLYKPVAATVYAAAFWAIGDAHNLNSLLTGIVMFFIALVALPALMRVVAPVVGILADDHGSHGDQAIQRTTVVATGAMNLGGMGSAGGAAGAGGGAAAGGAAAAAGPIAAGAVAAGVLASAAPSAVRKIGHTAASGAGGPNVVNAAWNEPYTSEQYD